MAKSLHSVGQKQRRELRRKNHQERDVYKRRENRSPKERSLIGEAESDLRLTTRQWVEQYEGNDDND